MPTAFDDLIEPVAQAAVFDDLIEPASGGFDDLIDPAGGEQPGRVRSGFGQAGRSFTSIGTGIVGGAAKMMDAGARFVGDVTGTQPSGFFGTIGDVADDVQAEANRMYPVNPEFKKQNMMVGGAAQGMGLLVGGAQAKMLGAGPTAIRAGQLTAAALQGANQGIDTAKAVGITSPAGQIGMGTAIGAIEAGTELIGGIGGKAATDAMMSAARVPLAQAVKRGAKDAASEIIEEPLAGAGQDLVTRLASPQDPNRPGYSVTGVKLPALDDQFVADRGMDTLGGLGGGVVVGALGVAGNALKPSGEDFTDLIDPVPQTGESPDFKNFDPFNQQAPAFEPQIPAPAAVSPAVSIETGESIVPAEMQVGGEAGNQIDLNPPPQNQVSPSNVEIASVTPEASPVPIPEAPASAPVSPEADAGSTPAAGASSQTANSGPGAAAASEYKASEALKSIDPTRFQQADRLNYRISPEAELDQIAAQMLDDGTLEPFTDQLLTQSPEEIGFTGREHVALAGQAMFRWEQRATAAEKAGDTGAQQTAEARAARLFELVQDGLNRGASVTQVGAYLIRSDPLFMLKRQIAKIEQAQTETATAQSGITPEMMEAEIKRRVQEELDKIAAQRDIDGEKEARTGTPRTPEGQAKILINTLAREFSDTPSTGASPPINQIKAIVQRAMKGETIDVAQELQALGVESATASKLAMLATEGARRAKAVAREKAAEQLIKRLQPKAPRAARSKIPKIIGKVLEANEVGVLTRADFLKAYREAFGIPNTLTPERASKLRKLAETIRNSRKGGADAAEAIAEMQDELALAKGLKVSDMIRSGWYGNLLSGIGTQTVNIGQNAANAARLVFRVGGDMIANRDAAALTGLLAAGKRGVQSGWRGFGDTLRTGHAYKGGEKYGDTSAAELAVKSWDEIGPMHKAVYLGMLQGATRRITRFLSGVDVGFNYTYRELASSLAAVRAARVHGYKPGTPEFRKAYEDELGVGDAQWTDFIAKANAEIKATGKKPLPGDLARRSLEMATADRAATLRDESHLLADRLTLQQQPEGIGKIISGIISAGQKAPVIGRAIVPFNRIVANAQAEALDYTPIGLLRAAKGGSLTGGANGRRYSKEERVERALAGTTGIALTLGAVAAAMQYADEDDGTAEFMIYGWGPTDQRKRDYWKSIGGQPYSMKVGDKWVRYADTPFSFALAIAGSFMDQYRYGDRTQSMWERLPLAVMASMGAVINFGPLAGPGKLAKTWTEAEQGRGTKNQIQDTVQTVMGLNGYMPVSGFARDMKLLLDPQKLDAKTLYGSLLKDYPYFGPLAGKPSLNRFGEPLETDDLARIPGVRRFVQGRKADPVTDWLASNQVYIPQAKRFTTIDTPARGEMKLTPQEQRRSDQGRYLARLTNGLLTEDEQRRFHQLSGSLLRDRLDSYRKQVDAARAQGRDDVTTDAINSRVEAMNEAANRVALYRLAAERVY